MKLLKSYIKSFETISSSNKHDDYINIKTEIKNKCKNDDKYKDIDYIESELERVEENIETKNAPYLSILYAFFGAILSLLIPTLINLNNYSNGHTSTNADQLFNALFMLLNFRR